MTARARRLRGATIVFDVVTVTGTENLMMAAALAKGSTMLENAACEPEVEELARVLNKMGAHIRGAGTSTISIEGVEELHPIDHAIIPDRIEAGTLMVAAAITRGNVLIRDCMPEHLDAVIAKLRAAGVEVSIEEGGVRVVGRGDFKPTDIATRPHPGFPTDMQAQFMVLMSRAKGQSVLSENIFENRFMHVPELMRMGADIVIDGRTWPWCAARSSSRAPRSWPPICAPRRAWCWPAWSPKAPPRSCASITSTGATTTWNASCAASEPTFGASRAAFDRLRSQRSLCEAGQSRLT